VAIAREVFTLHAAARSRFSCQEARVTDDEIDDRIYCVVLNDEEQYSIWLADRPIPAGWRSDGTRGSRAECLTHIDRVWTDMRPLSLRRRMAETESA
jgi:MbtH protein